jgi:hypothetical protein
MDERNVWRRRMKEKEFHVKEDLNAARKTRQ